MKTEKTIGEYASEEDSEEAFEECFQEHANSQMVCYRQVPGEILQPLFGAKAKGVRIDRILIPRQSLISEGWKMGAIGVEVKKSGHELGKAILQCMDYRRSVFQLPTGNLTQLQQVFIWPHHHTFCGLASVMQGCRIGGAMCKNGLRLYMDQTCSLHLENGNVRQIKELMNGYKQGSR